MKTFRSLFISSQTIYSDLTKPKLLTSAICIVALFSVDLTYGYHPISPYRIVWEILFDLSIRMEDNPVLLSHLEMQQP